MKTEQIKAGDKLFNQIDNNHKIVEVIERNGNLVFIQVTNSADQKYYNGATVFLDGLNERLCPWTINDPDMYRRSKETVYASYLDQVAKREQNAIRKANAKVEQDEKSRLDKICLKNAMEARELQKSLRTELVQAQLEATSLKAFLKDKKVQIEQLNAVNTLINSNIFYK